MQLNRKKMKYKNEKERSEWQLFVDDLTTVFFNYHRWGALAIEITFMMVLEVESKRSGF